MLLLSFQGIYAQNTSVSGKVIDRDTGEGVPFANVFFKGTTIGTTTNFDGFYALSSDKATDTLVVSYVGYAMKEKKVVKGKKQNINFQLFAEATTIAEIEIIAGEWENPAWEILRNVMKNKKSNDKRKLNAYQYESYSKIEVDIDNISEKFKKKKAVREIIQLLDSIEHIAGEDGKAILPLFISESISNFYYNKNPEKKREDILKTKITGIGIDDGSVVSQVIGSSYQEYNFYKNWMKIVQKDFVSPIADSWRVFYRYELKDEGMDIEGVKCSRIDFVPRSPQDLAFTGTMWITDSTFALKRIDVTVNKEANLNFIEKIKIQQNLLPVNDENGQLIAWLPAKTRVLLDIGEVKDNWAGMLAKFYTSNKDFKVNQTKPLAFYKEPMHVAEDSRESSDKYWDEHRHDSLTLSEKNVYHMIDTIKKLPTIRTYLEVANIIYNGYKKVGKFDLGGYIYMYANNNIEGNRLRFKAKTNEDFSKKIKLYGSIAYGTKDERIKYTAGFDYMLSRKNWTKFGFSHKFDINQVAFFSDDFRNSNNYLFLATTFWGDLDRGRPFLHTESDLYLQTDLFRGFTQKISFRNQKFDPLFKFEYFDLENPDIRKNKFTTSEIIFESRISFREKKLLNGNSRINLGSGGRPVFTLRYTLGLKDVLGGDFDYHKFEATVRQNFRVGLFGNSRYRFTAGYIPSKVPYPLLQTHLGNETVFFNFLSFNLMNYFEFVSDKYISTRYIHRFNGFFMNHIPLMRKLKWRTFVEGNFLYGAVSQKNRDIIPATDVNGEPIPTFNSLGNDPYIELSYGVENIFKFIKIQAIHRMTYRDNPDARNFGVKFSLYFTL